MVRVSLPQLAVCLSLALSAAGCQLPGTHSSTGWQFSVGKPATVESSALVHQGPGVMAVTPLATGSGMAVASQGPTLAFAQADPCAGSSPLAYKPGKGPAFASTAPECTLDEVCRKLDTLIRLNSERLPAPRPLP